MDRLESYIYNFFMQTAELNMMESVKTCMHYA